MDGRSRLEHAFGDTRLADDGLKCANTQFGVVWDWYGNRCIRQALLHDDMATSLSNLKESMARKYGANLAPGEDAELTQRRPPIVSHILPHACATESPRVKLFRKIALALLEDSRALPR